MGKLLVLLGSIGVAGMISIAAGCSNIGGGAATNISASPAIVASAGSLYKSTAREEGVFIGVFE